MNYKSDEERHQNTNPKSPQVLHNTLSIPLEDLLMRMENTSIEER